MANQTNIFTRVGKAIHNEIQSKYDYRTEFFKNNKGILGLYFCSYCFRPMINKRKMQVDHIMPKSKVFILFLGLFNKSWNLTVACPKCNKKKSNKINGQMVQGYAIKLITMPLKIIFMLVTGVLHYFFKALSWIVNKYPKTRFILAGLIALALGYSLVSLGVITLPFTLPFLNK